jgi:hypothetical protein
MLDYVQGNAGTGQLVIFFHSCRTGNVVLFQLYIAHPSIRREIFAEKEGQRNEPIFD